jgi:hypothetical protein
VLALSSAWCPFRLFVTLPCVRRERRVMWCGLVAMSGAMRRPDALVLVAASSEFAYFQTTDGGAQAFGSLIPLSFYVQQCMDIFGPQFNQTTIAGNVAWTNLVYGGRNVGAGGSNIVFPNGR